MKTRNVFLMATVIACILAPMAAFADNDPGKADPGIQPSTAAAGLCEQPMTFMGNGDGGGLDAVCSALCEDGSSVTCSGSSCSAEDNTCSTSGGSGECFGTSTGTLKCADCCTETVTATCPRFGSVSCTGPCHNSWAENGCAVYCDGVATMCPLAPPVCFT